MIKSKIKNSHDFILAMPTVLTPLFFFIYLQKIKFYQAGNLNISCFPCLNFPIPGAFKVCLYSINAFIVSGG
jgi:hypothetical protein